MATYSNKDKILFEGAGVVQGGVLEFICRLTNSPGRHFSTGIFGIFYDEYFIYLEQNYVVLWSEESVAVASKDGDGGGVDGGQCEGLHCEHRAHAGHVNR